MYSITLISKTSMVDSIGMLTFTFLDVLKALGLLDISINGSSFNTSISFRCDNLTFRPSANTFEVISNIMQNDVTQQGRKKIDREADGIIENDVEVDGFANSFVFVLGEVVNNSSVQN